MSPDVIESLALDESWLASANVEASPPPLVVLSLEQPAVAAAAPMPTTTTTWKSFLVGLGYSIPKDYHPNAPRQAHPLDTCADHRPGYRPCVLRRSAALFYASLAAACGGDELVAAPLDDHGGIDAAIAIDAGAAVDATPDTKTDAPPFDAACSSAIRVDTRAVDRTACTFAAGARVADTLAFTAAERAKLPITHVIVVVQENRSFDHYFGRLSQGAQIEAEGWPAGYTNADTQNIAVAPQHLASACLPVDPPHQAAAMVAGWNNGAMNGFVKSASSSTNDGHFAVGYYDGTDLPFYYWLASTYAIADRYFGSALGGTWANRDFLYAATSDGVLNTGERTITVPTIFDALDTAHVAWGVYSDGTPRQDALGWTTAHAGVHTFSTLLSQLADGTLPPVSFVDPSGSQDEHPTNAINGGEKWTRSIYQAALASPLWSRLAIVFTYDESGGLFDHVPPPKACAPSASLATFNRYGVRIPAIVISPYARRHFVSHAVHDHTSTLRLIETLHDLPALTARDANADALLDMFDFDCAPQLAPPAAPAAGTRTCP